MEEHDPAKKAVSSGSTFGSISRQRSAKGNAVLGTWRSLAFFWQRGDSAGIESRAPCQLPIATLCELQWDAHGRKLWTTLDCAQFSLVADGAARGFQILTPRVLSGNPPAAVGTGGAARTGKGLTARRRLARHQFAPHTSQEARPAQGGEFSHCFSHLGLMAFAAAAVKPHLTQPACDAKRLRGDLLAPTLVVCWKSV